MASLDYRKNKTSYIRYRVNKRSSRKSIGVVSYETAMKILRKFDNDLALKKFCVLEDEEIEICVFLDEYFKDWVKKENAENTYTSKLFAKKKLLEYMQKSRQIIFIHDISTKVIEDYKTFRLETGIKETSINAELRMISHVVRTAKQWGYLVNKRLKVKLCKEEKKESRVLSDEEKRLILTKSSNYFRQIVYILIYTGFRISEVLNLKWDQVDFKKNVIKIKIRDDYNTKTKEERSIPMNDSLANHLHTLKINFFDPVTDKMTYRNPAQKEFVICKRDGSKIKSIRKSFAKRLNELGISGASPHTLRHTFASECLMSGISIYTVKEYLGHSSVKMTERYCNLTDKHKKEQINKLPDFSEAPSTDRTSHSLLRS